MSNLEKAQSAVIAVLLVGISLLIIEVPTTKDLQKLFPVEARLNEIMRVIDAENWKRYSSAPMEEADEYLTRRFGLPEEATHADMLVRAERELRKREALQ